MQITRNPVFLIVLAVAAFISVYALRNDHAEVAGLQALRQSIVAQQTLNYTSTIQTRIPDGDSVKTTVFDVMAEDGKTQYTSLPGETPCSAVINSSPSGMTVPGNSLALDGEIELIGKNYAVRLIGREEVGNRAADKLVLTPRYHGRPALHLWIDRKTALPVRVRKYDDRNQLVAETTSRILTASRSGNGDGVGKDECKAGCCTAKKQDVSPSLYIENVSIAQIQKAIGSAPVEKRIPPGFKLVERGIYSCACGCNMKSAISHYTDGVASFSIFATSSSAVCCDNPMCVPAKSGNSPTITRLQTGEYMATWTGKKTTSVVIGDLSKSEVSLLIQAQKKG